MASIPEDISSLWKSLDPAVRAALIESESKSNTQKTTGGASSSAGGQGRRALSSTGQSIDPTSQKLIGGASFTNRENNPQWIKVRGEVYDAIKSKRDEELSKKVPVDISVTLPDGKVLSEDKVSLLFVCWFVISLIVFVYIYIISHILCQNLNSF